MAKKLQGQIATVTVFSIGANEYKGSLNTETAHGFDVTYKRPRSSKFDRKIFPKSDVLYAYQDGDNFVISVREEIELDSFEGTVTHSDDGTVRITTAAGSVTIPQSSFTRIEISVEVADEPAPAKAKAKKASKDSSAKVKAKKPKKKGF